MCHLFATSRSRRGCTPSVYLGAPPSVIRGMTSRQGARCSLAHVSFCFRCLSRLKLPIVVDCTASLLNLFHMTRLPVGSLNSQGRCYVRVSTPEVILDNLRKLKPNKALGTDHIHSSVREVAEEVAYPLSVVWHEGHVGANRLEESRRSTRRENDVHPTTTRCVSCWSRS